MRGRALVDTGVSLDGGSARLYRDPLLMQYTQLMTFINTYLTLSRCTFDQEAEKGYISI